MERDFGASKAFKIVSRHDHTNIEESAIWLDFGGGLYVTKAIEFFTTYRLDPTGCGSVYENAE